MNQCITQRIALQKKFYLYETLSYFYLIGENENKFRVIKLDRRVIKPHALSDILTEDSYVYSKDELQRMLDMISDGNKSSGGLVPLAIAFGFLGFTKFLDSFYMTLITQRKRVGKISANHIYAIKSTEIFAIKPRDEFSNEMSLRRIWHNVNKRLSQTPIEIAESRYMGLFTFIDTSKDFFFSYTYDLTHSSQKNYVVAHTHETSVFQEMFAWNHYQTAEFKQSLSPASGERWIMPVIHGSFQQRRFSHFGQYVDLILIARRSRHYAGTRYLKRGISAHGKVANDCETELILQSRDTGHGEVMASYLQMRGSVPTYWQQETSVTMPMPPIVVNRVDPSYLATQEHFADLMRRYGSPVTVLDLLKQKERAKRESIIGSEFRYAVSVVNCSMDKDHAVRYCALDFSRISKSSVVFPVPEGTGPADADDGRAAGAAVGNTGVEWRRFENTLKSSGQSAILSDEAALIHSAPSPRGSVTAAPEQDILGKVPGSAHTKANVSSASSAASTPTPAPTMQPQQSGSSEDRGDILRELENISNWTLSETAFFSSCTAFLDQVPAIKDHMAAANRNGFLKQTGVLRTNCLDCLDRTNVAQFATGVRFLNLGLATMGILGKQNPAPSNLMVLGLMDMFSGMGDRLALQYGGSEAHKKVTATQGSVRKQSKHGYELLTSIKRYYSNAFTDRVKQDAMNLFLGYFVPSREELPLWEMESDYFLHNAYFSPPQPLVDAVLFGPRTESLPIDPPEPESAVLERYIWSGDKGPEEVLPNILACVERKRRVRERCDLLREAMSHWWRSAIEDFDKSSTVPTMTASAAFSTVAQVREPEAPWRDCYLTSFDDVLAQDYCKPFDAAAAASAKSNTGACYWPSNSGRSGQSGDNPPLTSPGRPNNGADKRQPTSVLSELSDSPDRVMYPKAIEGGPVDTDENATAFRLGTYVLSQIGQKVSGLVDGLIRWDNSHPVSPEVKGSTPGPDGVNEVWSGGRVTVDYSDVEYSDCHSSNVPTLYLDYVNAGRHPEHMIGSERAEVRMEFEASLSASLVSSDDLQRMESLSESFGISSGIREGEYRGMHQSESAAWATAIVSIGVAHAEAQSADYKTASATLQRVVSGTNGLPSQVQEGLNLLCKNETLESAYFSFLDPEQLSNRLSPTTTAGTISTYCSLVDKDGIEGDAGVIQYIVSDRLDTVGNPLETLEPVYGAEVRRRLAPSMSGMINKSVTASDEISKFSFMYADVYCKNDNPWFQVNSVGAETYVRALSSVNN